MAPDDVLLGYVTGESVPSRFGFVSHAGIVPPRLEYVVVRGARERVGGADTRVDLLGQVTGIVADVVTLDDRIDFEGATVVLDHGATVPARVRVHVATIGHLDGAGAVRPARNAVLPGTPVFRAPDDLLRQFFSRAGPSGVAATSTIALGTLLDRPGVPVALDANGLSRHLAIIAQTGAGKSYLAGKVLEELLGLGATIVVLDPNSDYVQLRKVREDADVPYAAARTVRHADRMRLYRVPVAGRQRYGDDLCGPSSPYTIRFAELDGDEICDVAGVPTTAERIREAVATACARFRRDRIEYNPQLLARELAAMAGIEGDDATADPPSIPGADDASVDTLDRLAMPRRGALPRPEAPRARGGVDGTLGASARAALRYVRKLEKYPIWSLSTIDIDSLVRPMSLTVIDLAGAEKGVMAYTAEWLLSNLWQRALGGELPHPVFVVLEEAHNLVPGGREVTRASRIVNVVAAEGRKFGVFLIVITQRPSKISDDTLSQCASQLVMRLTNPDDQKAVQRASEVVSQSLLEDLPGLGQGEVVVLGRLTRIPAMVRVGGRAGAEGGADIDLADRFMRARRLVEDRQAVARDTAPDLPPLMRPIRPRALD